MSDGDGVTPEASSDPRMTLVERLRADQTRLFQRAFPGLARSGAVPTARSAVLEGGVVMQRVTVEFPQPVDADEVLAVAAEVFAVVDGQWEERDLAGEALRVDFTPSDGALHSVAILCGGTVVQCTSFAGGESAEALRGNLDAEEAVFGPSYGYEPQLRRSA